MDKILLKKKYEVTKIVVCCEVRCGRCIGWASRQKCRAGPSVCQFKHPTHPEALHFDTASEGATFGEENNFFLSFHEFSLNFSLHFLGREISFKKLAAEQKSQV